MTKSAFLVLDIQKGVVEGVQTADNYFPRLAATVHEARRAGIPIIHIATAFRDGHPEISARNLIFSRVASAGAFVEGDESSQFHELMTPSKEDVVVTKRRVSAFSGSDLDIVLRALNVQHLIMAGLATSGAVLSTVRQAADLDYGITVLKDLCMDMDLDVHNVLVDKVFPRQANVVSSEHWLEQLQTH
jgi:nicotinamidase-related amidase